MIRLDIINPMMYRSRNVGQRAFGQVVDPSGHGG